MPLTGFYNENENRDWPFLDRPGPLDYTDPDEETEGFLPLVEIPQEAIVDFGAIMAVDSEFDASSDHYVYLRRIARDGTTVVYDFRTNAPGAAGERCIFRRDLGDEEFLCEWVDSEPITDDSGFSSSSSAAVVVCTEVRKWQAFLVTGRFLALEEALADGAEITFPRGLWQVEPSRIQNLSDSYVRSLNIANFDRIRASGTEECDSLGGDTRETIVQDTCVQGPVRFKEGYNCAIRQESRSNTLFFGAGVGAGLGEPCGEIPLTDDEEAPEGSPFLSGGPSCRQLVTAINGVTGRNLVIVGGPGFQVAPSEDDEHTLIIDRNLADFAACPDDAIIDSSLGDEG